MDWDDSDDEADIEVATASPGDDRGAASLDLRTEHTDLTPNRRSTTTSDGSGAGGPEPASGEGGIHRYSRHVGSG